MRIAALYDIHGNLPALDAVLAEVDLLDVDAIVVGGDVVPGPMMAETVARLRSLGDRAQFVMGNGDREVIDAFDAGPEAAADAGESRFSRFTAWAATRLAGPTATSSRASPPSSGSRSTTSARPCSATGPRAATPR